MMVKDFGKLSDGLWAVHVKVEDIAQCEFKRVARICLHMFDEIGEL